jgi:hypothetical protein
MAPVLAGLISLLGVAGCGEKRARAPDSAVDLTPALDQTLPDARITADRGRMSLDGALPDLTAPDSASPDSAPSDSARPDLRRPDLLRPDLRRRDLLRPDLGKCLRPGSTCAGSTIPCCPGTKCCTKYQIPANKCAKLCATT